MKSKTWFYKYIIPSATRFVVTIYSHCIRLTLVGKENVDIVKESGKPVIYAFIHGRQFFVYHLFGGKNICVMSSTSRDGRLQAAILEKFGFKIAWGSTAKSPVRALIGIIKMMKAGHDSIMAVDGPKGPLYQVKPGILFLAKKCNAVIIPFVFSAKKAVIMKAWDKYMLPKPFTKAVGLYGKPFFPSDNTGKDTIDKESKELQKVLLDLMLDADELSGWQR